MVGTNSPTIFQNYRETMCIRWCISFKKVMKEIAIMSSGWDPTILLRYFHILKINKKFRYFFFCFAELVLLRVTWSNPHDTSAISFAKPKSLCDLVIWWTVNSKVRLSALIRSTSQTRLAPLQSKSLISNSKFAKKISFKYPRNVYKCHGFEYNDYTGSKTKV